MGARGHATLTLRARAWALAGLALWTGLFPTTARAGETDQFYAWQALPRDSTAALNDFFNDRFEIGLGWVNSRPWRESMQCIDVAREMTSTIFWFEYGFEFGAARGYGIKAAPASNTELLTRYRDLTVYRDAPITQPFLKIKRRPAVLVADTWIGLDKVSHLRDEGLNYYRRYHEALAAGATEEEALDAAMLGGVEQEEGLLGRFFTGIFSFADLEANARGLRFFRDLCDGEEPDLILDDGRWRLRERFDFGRYVTPCFDESWLLNSQPEEDRDWMQPALVEYCKLRTRPEVAARHARYRQRGCDADVAASFERLSQKGLAPSREGAMLDDVCAALARPSPSP